MTKVLVKTWSEYERGWGNRPDGISIHFSKDQLKKCIEDHWEHLNELYGPNTPDEFNAPDDECAYWATIVESESTEEITKAVLKGETFWHYKTQRPKWLKKL